MRDEKMFKEYMTGLGELHHRKITDVIKNMYWKILAPYSDDQCQQAFEIALRECSFFPKPNELLKYIAERQEDKAVIALNLVIYAVERVGNYESVKFPDGAIHSVIEMLGGWVKFSTATEEEWTWLKKDFLKFYPTMAKKKGHLEYLPGTHEIQNNARGLEWKKAPLLIKFPARRKQLPVPKQQEIKNEPVRLRPVGDVLTNFAERVAL